ncbi:TSL-kinase interacting protein [Trifolium repens]|nr:TSL-kinase interacting protein [Trifolium repens]
MSSCLSSQLQKNQQGNGLLGLIKRRKASAPHYGKVGKPKLKARDKKKTVRPGDIAMCKFESKAWRYSHERRLTPLKEHY